MTARADLRALAQAATPGPWHHCQPFQIVPKARTVHGPVPAQRVDYVSTWPQPGTPPGHRVIIPMAGSECHVRSDDMAYIAAASPDVVLALLDDLDALGEALAAVLPMAEAAHDAAMSAQGHTGRPWPDEIVAARAALARSERAP